MGNKSSRENSESNSRKYEEDRRRSDKRWRDRLEVVMKRGGCEEAFTAYEDCHVEAAKKKETLPDCFRILLSCIEAHPDNYQPYLAARKASLERVGKELAAFFEEKGYYEFMEGGGCKESFTVWEACNEEAEKRNESTTNCEESFTMLMSCMEAHSDYYQPILPVNFDQHRAEDMEFLFEEGSKAEG